MPLCCVCLCLCVCLWCLGQTRAGVSRSPALLIAYLVREGMSLNNAMKLILKERPIVCPNSSFRLQLAQLELDLRGYSTVADSPHEVWNFHRWNAVKGSVRRAPPS